MRYMVGKQWVGFSPAPDASATDRMDHIAFTTDNVAGLRAYLISKHVKVPIIEGHADQRLGFAVVDPDGYRVEFVEHDQKLQQLEEKSPEAGPPWVSHHMIHT